MNQLDVEERNHQVSLMSRIYSNAETVFAYVGPEPPEDILDTHAFTSNTLYRLLDGCKTKVVLTLLDITQREYWSRLWIVQELRCACQAIVWCGRYSIQRDDLYENLADLRFKQKAERHLYESTSTDQALLSWECIGTFDILHSKRLNKLLAPQENAATTDLWDVLDTYSGNACKDPRDRIYGLQSLVPTKERIPIDHSISFEQLLYNIIRDRFAPCVYYLAIPSTREIDGRDDRLV
jgi:hypothetical protein